MNKTTQAFNKLYEEQRQKLIRLLRQVPTVVDATQKLSGLLNSENYRVRIPPNILQQIRKGSAHFGESATGGLSANIHDDTGKIIGQISLAQASPELVSSFGQMAIQSTLAEIVEHLNVIEQKIEQGPRDDRAGLVDSGEDLYVLASTATDSENRRLLLMNAVAQLSEARGRLIRDLAASIQSIDEIPTGKWEIIRASLRRNIPKEVERKSSLLENSLRNVLRASYLLSLSCGQLGEPILLRESWQPLERFIPQLEAAQAKIVRWLPDDPNALPDKFSTLVSAAYKIVQAGKQLESSNMMPLEIGLTRDEIMDEGVSE